MAFRFPILIKLSQNLCRRRSELSQYLQRRPLSSGDEDQCCNDKEGNLCSGMVERPSSCQDQLNTTIHNKFEVPDFLCEDVFRKFESKDEKLGPGAGKCDKYKNAEYFGYHRFSFADLVTTSLDLRDQRIKDDGARCIYKATDD
ncbi:uncharacterized protein LOC119690201 [Teleopsis dalmanni]|uniref:uncharacterized protein LOC119690201 n=1 Tax=Teleopsis dalmanni TaxID=139649 RepID=UPI0018CD2F40|nr:uncharacterized protein LOC119690201 [Teleopsis dalmanni]